LSAMCQQVPYSMPSTNCGAYRVAAGFGERNNF
jgi:hypothetical protein